MNEKIKEYEGLVAMLGKDLERSAMKVHKQGDDFNFVIIEKASVDEETPTLKTIRAWGVWVSNRQARDLAYSLLRFTKKYKADEK